MEKWRINNGTLKNPEILTIYSNESKFLINIENYSEFILTNAKLLHDKENIFKSVFNGGSVSWSVSEIYRVSQNQLYICIGFISKWDSSLAG